MTRTLACALALVLAFGLAWLLASSDPPAPGGVAAFEAVNGLSDTAVLRVPVVGVMQLGALWMVPVVAVGVATLAVSAGAGRTRRLATVAAAVGFAGVAAWWLSNLVKDLAERPRPAPDVLDVVVRETPSGWGFPSGHAAVAMALAVVTVTVLPISRRWIAVALALAVAVGLARVYVGVHYPLDVLGGWSLGAFVGLVVGVVAAVILATVSRSVPS